MHVTKSHSKVWYIKHINVPVDRACIGISSSCILSKYHQMTRLVCLYDKHKPYEIVQSRIIFSLRVYVNKKSYTIWTFITLTTFGPYSATELFYLSRTHAIYCRQDILFLPYEIKAFRYSHDIPYGNNLPYYHIESNNDIRGSSHI